MIAGGTSWHWRGCSALRPEPDQPDAHVASFARTVPMSVIYMSRPASLKRTEPYVLASRLNNAS